MIHVEFISGIYMATFAFSGVFFLKFWKASKDRFFLFFCLACWLIAAERVALFFVEGGYTSDPNAMETRSWAYLIRLVAYCFIFYAIVDRNRKASR
jgi:hypothetical protein